MKALEQDTIQVGEDTPEIVPSALRFPQDDERKESFLEDDIAYMKRALDLAKLGLGWTRPNPMVGAVIVRNGEVIGEGYHRQDGEAHAEIEAFMSTSEDLEGATMYVSLEPCSHEGRTGSCAQAIIRSSITRVVCATLDPFPEVQGRGIAMLEEAGVEVVVGVMEEDARLLNEIFITAHTKQRPFVAVKFACSLDGRIATRTGHSKWITGDEARAYARELRGHYQAILVGIGTVLADNPHLGVRDAQWKDPLRVILDSTLRIPADADVLRDGNVLVATSEKADAKKLKALEKKGVEVMKLGTKRVDLEMLMKELWKRRVTSLYIEGGGEVIGSFVDAELVDRVYAFQAPMVLGGNEAKSAVGGNGPETVMEALHLVDVERVELGKDMLTTGRVARY